MERNELGASGQVYYGGGRRSHPSTRARSRLDSDVVIVTKPNRTWDQSRSLMAMVAASFGVAEPAVDGASGVGASGDRPALPPIIRAPGGRHETRTNTHRDDAVH